MSKPIIITLCGSSKFCELMAVCAWIIERDERAITMGLHLLPNWYPVKCPDHIAEYENCADAMDELHKRKIDISDEIFVVNFNDYIGESTRSEIEYAKRKGKKIRYYNSDIIKRKIAKILEELK